MLVKNAKRDVEIAEVKGWNSKTKKRQRENKQQTYFQSEIISKKLFQEMSRIMLFIYPDAREHSYIPGN